MKSIIYFFTGLVLSAIVIALLYYAIYGIPNLSLGLLARCIFAFIASIPVHEFIHGVTSCYVSENNYKTISYGIKLSEFYAFCKYSLPVDPQLRKYVAIMPCVILAVLPALVGILFDIPSLCVFATFSFAGSSKDIHNFVKMIRKNRNCS